MSRLTTLAPTLVACLLLTAALSAQTVGSSGAVKVNLDLPYDASLYQEDSEEEDAPEIINFYGQLYEGDAVVFAIDTSSSMEDDGELQIAKREVLNNIADFSTRMQFAVIFFNSRAIGWPKSGRPAAATGDMKRQASMFVQSVRGEGQTCPAVGLLTALRYANLCTAKRSVLLYVGDGGVTCGGANQRLYMLHTLETVKANNFQRVQINCVGVRHLGELEEEFLVSLSRSNGGRFTRIQR